MSRISFSEDPGEPNASSQAEAQPQANEEPATTMPLTAMGSGEGFGDMDSFSEEENDEASSSSNLLQNGFFVIGLVAIVGVGAIVGMRMTQSRVATDSSTQAAEAKIEDALSRFHNSGQMSPNDPLRGFRDGGDPLTDDRQLIRNLAPEANTRQVPIRYVQKNPFKLTLPKPEPKADDSPRARAAAEARSRQQEQRHIAQLKKEARKLQLNMVMKGPQLTAVINGNLYKKGDKLGSFHVENIEPSRVNLRTGKYRFGLKISGD